MQEYSKQLEGDWPNPVQGGTEGAGRLRSGIDRLDIDQSNIEERNHQVSLMKSIYARRKLFKLGEVSSQ